MASTNPAAGDACTICLEPLGESAHALEECGHRYHVDCIMRWFRSGNEQCPLCRGRDFRPYRYMAVGERARILRRSARRRSAPRRLKRAVQRLRDKEERQREAFRTLKAFRAEHRDLLKEHDRLQRKYASSQDSTDDAWYKLGICEFTGVVVPLVTEDSANAHSSFFD